jgi:hypothetical protein
VSNYTKKIVCLAKSTKTGGRCIAGREVLEKGYGGWIRPVSDRLTAEVSAAEYRYERGGYCQLLDIVEIPFLRAEPRQHQTENHVIDAQSFWVKGGTASWDDLALLIEQPPSLWLNGYHTKPGLNDCISETRTPSLNSSLLLIAPKDFTVHVGIEHPDTPWAKQGVRGDFKYRRTDYSLRITDPVVDRHFRSKGNGNYRLNDVYICVSLTEPYEDHRCHKLVAAIFSKQPLR